MSNWLIFHSVRQVIARGTRVAALPGRTAVHHVPPFPTTGGHKMRHLGFLSASILAAVALASTTTLAGAQSTTDKTAPTTGDKIEQKAEDTKDKVKDSARDTKDKIKDTAEDTKDKVKDTAHDAKDKLKEKGHQAADKARDLKDRMKDKMHSRSDKPAQDGQDRVKAIQQALKDKGFDPGPIDGIQGPQTTAALKAYQQAEGLEATGRVDTRTMSKLSAAEPPATSSTPSGSSAPSAPGASRKQTP
jgi:putative peptidoglycan binding protein